MLRHSYFETVVREPVPVEADVYRLLIAFEIAVHGGQALAFETFKQLWQARQFSFIFEVCMSSDTWWTNYAYFYSVMHASEYSLFLFDRLHILSCGLIY